MQVIIDTDIGDDVDDVLALAFALRRPEFEVLGITTVCGNVDGRCRMVSRLLRGMKLGGITVAAGRKVPLNEKQANINRLQRTPYQAAFAGDELSRPWPDAISFIIDTVRRNSGNVGIITLGPMTNVGAALQQEPNLGKHVKFLACMGGSAQPDRREYNVASDPEASHLVFTSNIPTFLGTWETTRQFILYPPDEQKIAATPTTLAQMLWENIELWRPVQGAKPGPVLYDVAPVIWSMRPDLYPTEPRQVQMVLEGPRRGCMDLMPSQVSGGVALSVGIHVEEVKQLFLQTILA